MAQVQPIVRIELDPTKPVPEICAIIASVMPYNVGHEEAILKGVRDAIDQHLERISKEGEKLDVK